MTVVLRAGIGRWKEIGGVHHHAVVIIAESWGTCNGNVWNLTMGVEIQMQAGFFFHYSSLDNVRILVAFLEFCWSFCPNQGVLSQNLPDTCSWLEKTYSIMVQRGKHYLLLPK